MRNTRATANARELPGRASLCSRHWRRYLALYVAHPRRRSLILGSYVNGMVERAGAFYDRVMSRNADAESCGYLFAKK